jgi:thiosulfate reductase cytochrome b subunit
LLLYQKLLDVLTLLLTRLVHTFTMVVPQPEVVLGLLQTLRRLHFVKENGVMWNLVVQ